VSSRGGPNKNAKTQSYKNIVNYNRNEPKQNAKTQSHKSIANYNTNEAKELRATAEAPPEDETNGLKSL